MFERNEKGYIVGNYPVTTKTLDGYKYLIMIKEDALSEYSKDAFNRVLYYFQEKLGLKVFVDNLNHTEWKESIGTKSIVEIKNRANISYTPAEKSFAEDFIKNFSAEFPESSREVFQKDLSNTLLSVCIEKDGEYIHIELPYCTIEKICDAIGNINIE